MSPSIQPLAACLVKASEVGWMLGQLQRSSILFPPPGCSMTCHAVRCGGNSSCVDQLKGIPSSCNLVRCPSLSNCITGEDSRSMESGSGVGGGYLFLAQAVPRGCYAVSGEVKSPQAIPTNRYLWWCRLVSFKRSFQPVFLYGASDRH